MSADVLLRAKVTAPPSPVGLVARRRLYTTLDAGLRARLTLISGPAGAGKSTLLAAWLSDRGVPFGWLSLDAADGDLRRFLRYLAAAVRAAGVSAAPDALTGDVEAAVDALDYALDAPPAGCARDGATGTAVAVPLPPDPAAGASGPVPQRVLVLDDYHVLHSPCVHEAVARLVEHLPPSAHLYIASRTDPPLPLARLRAHGQLVEVRSDSLAFTEPEAAAFFGEAMRLTLAPEQVRTLVERTEGWAAGLQLAALTLRGHGDPTAFIRSFSGSNRFVLDLLTEEVLERLPRATQRFLLRTSVLERLSAELCEAVTGWPGAQATLEALDRENVFLLPLDEERCWYRYHHLFRSLLRARLRQTDPAMESELHARAAAWWDSPAATAAVHGTAESAVAQALVPGGSQREAHAPTGAADAANPPGADGPAHRAALVHKANARLVEPLTERELEVLRLVAAGRSNREIAAELFLALGTVKAHVHAIFGKLGAAHRTHAVARARELALTP